MERHCRRATVRRSPCPLQLARLTTDPDRASAATDQVARFVNMVRTPSLSTLMATTCAELRPFAFSADMACGIASMEVRRDLISSCFVFVTWASTCERRSAFNSSTSITWILRISTPSSDFVWDCEVWDCEGAGEVCAAAKDDPAKSKAR